MCKTYKVDFSKLKPSKVPTLLKNFPACGVRYQTDGDYGVVLVHHKVADQELIRQKREAAKIKAKKVVLVVEIPEIVCNMLGVRYG